MFRKVVPSAGAVNALFRFAIYVTPGAGESQAMQSAGVIPPSARRGPTHFYSWESSFEFERQRRDAGRANDLQRGIPIRSRRDFANCQSQYSQAALSEACEGLRYLFGGSRSSRIVSTRMTTAVLA